jgi:mannan endo-1,4-beta-mannosidase
MKAFGLFLLLVLAVSSFDQLINPNATIEAQNLYQKLIDNNGKAVFSGQTTFNYDNFVTQTGKFPMVRGFDMQNYSPNNPWYSFKPYDDGTVSLAIDWYTRMTNRTGIVTFFWHWFSPINGWERTSTFYTSNTGFDVSKAIINGTA